tara:strand:- start:1495 stop:2061 length:567 start_codon:yes stop_codon:yes gene_type:complete
VFSQKSFSVWTKVFEKEGISIYTSSNSQGILPFKAYATLEVNIKELYDILIDHKRKSLWSPKLKKLVVHETISGEEYIFSEYYKTPWPAMDREFLLKGKVFRYSDDKFILEASSVVRNDLKSRDHVQADVEKIFFSAEKVDSKNSKVTFEFKGDLKGWIPVWLSNIIQKKWPYRFLRSLENYSKEKLK